MEAAADHTTHPATPATYADGGLGSDYLAMRSTDVLSEDTLRYLKQKRVPEVMEYLLRSIVKEQPESVTRYIQELTAQQLPPHIMIAGPPVSGKGTQCRNICNFMMRKSVGGTKSGRKLVHISSGNLLRSEIECGTETGKIAQGYMHDGKLVPDSLIVGMVRRRLQQEDCILNGWLLDGFPRNREQAMALDAEGFSPDVFILLECPDEVLIERVEGRRIDPATNATYHLTFNPPPEDDQALMDRLEHRDDDTREVVKPRLESYHGYIGAIMEFYAPVAARVDANRPDTDICNDITAILEEKRLA